VFDTRKDIQAMTTFRRNPGKSTKRLKKTKDTLLSMRPACHRLVRSKPPASIYIFTY